MFIFKPQSLAACALIAAFSAPAFAATSGVADVALTTLSSDASYGQWNQFNVNDFDSLTAGVEWIDNANTLSSTFGKALNFTFTIAAGSVGQLTVVDGALAGDTFKLMSNGSFLGSSSTVAVTDYFTAADTGYDFNAALTNASFSQGVFSLGAGSYRISGVLDQSVMLEGTPLNSTVGALRLTVAPVPEPSSFALMLAGLGLFGTIASRRRSKSAQ